MWPWPSSDDLGTQTRSRYGQYQSRYQKLSSIPSKLIAHTDRQTTQKYYLMIGPNSGIAPM